MVSWCGLEPSCLPVIPRTDECCGFDGLYPQLDVTARLGHDSKGFLDGMAGDPSPVPRSDAHRLREGSISGYS